MGGVARSGILIEEFISTEEIYKYIDAMKKLLNEQAGTESAGMKVRTRHLLNKVGDDEFIRYFRNSLSAENKQYTVNLKQLEKIEECNEVEHNIEDWIIKTSVRGKYALEYKPQGGNIDSAKIEMDGIVTGKQIGRAHV